MIMMPRQCLRCRHYRGSLECDAYPDMIPEAIEGGSHDHRQPHEDDHGIRFEPKSGQHHPAEDKPRQ